MSGSTNHPTDHEFARRAATYLREQGLTDDQVQSALVAELGLPTPEAEEILAKAA
jgi:hypothetical protein